MSLGEPVVFNKLSDKERDIVLQSLNAVLNGGFLAGEFQTRLGIEPEQLEQVISAYPNLIEMDESSNVNLAINNCLNEVCNGISFSSAQWSRWFNVTRSDVDEVYRKWRGLRGDSSSAI